MSSTGCGFVHQTKTVEASNGAGIKKSASLVICEVGRNLHTGVGENRLS